jgi:uncharacterized protein HemX
MRKLMMAVVAVAGVAVGCQKNDVQKERQDVAEAQREATQERQEIQRDTQQEMAELRQEQQQELTDLNRDVQEEQKDVAEAQREQLNDQDEAIGGSGDTMANAKTEQVEGTIQSASANNITLWVPDQDNKLMKFQADKNVRVMRDDKPVALTELKAGDEVRASYQLDQAGKMVLRSIEVEKQSAQHPNKQMK